MKKLKLLLFIIFFFGISHLGFAQTESQLFYNGNKIFESSNGITKGDSLMKANHVASQTVKYTELKNGKERNNLSYLYKYDEQGRRILVQQFDKNNKSNWYYQYNYDSLGRIWETTTKRRKNTTRVIYEFGPFKEVIRVRYFNGQDTISMKLSKVVVNSFNTDSNKTTSITFNHKEKIIATVVYEYETTKKLGRAKYYGKKGKLKYSWNFDCSKQGELELKKNEQKICKNSVQLENGHRQEITINENKNNIVRKIAEFDEKGVFVKSEEFVGKNGNILNYSNVVSTVADTTISSALFYTGTDRRNFLRYSIETKHVKHQMVKANYNMYYKNNKLSSSVFSAFIYTPSGLIEKENSSDVVNKTISTKVYQYSFR